VIGGEIAMVKVSDIRPRLGEKHQYAFANSIRT
jgi:hypothetical protein